MKKTEKTKLANTLTRTNTAKLTKDLHTLESWEENHKRRKNSYFWRPSPSARERRAAEDRYTFTESLAFSDITLTYASNRGDSCNYIYWTDRLDINIPGANITFGDIAFILATIKDIIARRDTEKSA